MFLPSFHSINHILRFSHDHINKISEVTTIIITSMDCIDFHVIKEMSPHGMIENNGVIQTEP